MEDENGEGKEKGIYSCRRSARKKRVINGAGAKETGFRDVTM